MGEYVRWCYDRHAPVAEGDAIIHGPLVPAGCTLLFDGTPRPA